MREIFKYLFWNYGVLNGIISNLIFLGIVTGMMYLIRNLFYRRAVLVDLRKLTDDDVEIETPKAWDAKTEKVFGNDAEGDFNIKNGILTIIRRNIEGRYLVRFMKYKFDGKYRPFISNSDHSRLPMRLYLSFEAKVTHGAHTFRIMCKNYNKDQWVPGASFLTFRVSSNEYQKYRRELTIPVGFDFRIQVDDIENENPNSSILIKNFKLVKFNYRNFKN